MLACIFLSRDHFLYQALSNWIGKDVTIRIESHATTAYGVDKSTQLLKQSLHRIAIPDLSAFTALNRLQRPRYADFRPPRVFENKAQLLSRRVLEYGTNRSKRFLDH